MVTQSELIVFAGMSKPMLVEYLRGMTFSQAMEARRDIQKAVTEYSRTHSKFDAVKDGALEVCQRIERYCRSAFYRRRIPEILRQGNAKNFQTAKYKCRIEYESMVSRLNY